MEEYTEFLQELGLITEDGDLIFADHFFPDSREHLPDELLGALWRTGFALRERSIEDDNILAFLCGRSAYLRERSAVRLLIEDLDEYEDIVFEAAMAWATSETPQEFLNEHPSFT